MTLTVLLLLFLQGEVAVSARIQEIHAGQASMDYEDRRKWWWDANLMIEAPNTEP